MVISICIPIHLYIYIYVPYICIWYIHILYHQYIHIHIYMYIYSCDILQHNQREAIGWFWVPAESVKQWLVNHCCCLAHSTDELFAFSSQERATKWYSPTLKVFQNGSDLRTQVKNVAWTRGSFFLHQKIIKVCPGSRIMRLKPYESIIFPHSRTTWPSWTLLLQSRPRRPPEARRKKPFKTFGPGERSVLGPRKKSSLNCKYM